MPSQMNPYLMFAGRAREALDFYAGVFGGTPQVMTFADMGMEAAGVMHGYLGTDDGYALMISDAPPDHTLTSGNDRPIALSGDDAERLRAHFRALSDGGTVHTPLEKQMWGDEFGNLTDRFGVEWLVNISG